MDVAASDSTVECDGTADPSGAFAAWLSTNGGASASDSCSGVTWTNDSTGLSDLCGATGTETVTFTATDECGNATSTTATFTIEDTTNPTMDVAASDLIIQCDVDNSAAIDAWLSTNGGASASDVCSGVTWTNDFTTLSEATQKLIESDRKQIILLSTIHKLNVGKQRAQGYVRAMEASGLTPVLLESTDKLAGSVMADYLKSNPVDAIMALDTDASLAALKAVKLSGKKIPQDIAVIGYVSERMAHNLTPELTTINQHSYTIGNSAATMMVESLRTKSSEVKQVVISSTLSVRDSS